MRASLASYARYWREAFRLPTMDLPRAGQPARRLGLGTRQSGGGAGRGPRRCHGVAAQRQLGYGRGVAGADPRHLHHRRGAAQTRVVVPAFHRLPRKPRLRGVAAVRRRTTTLRGAVRAAARQPGGLPDGRARPEPHRRRGRLLRRSPPGCRPGPAKLAIATGAALLPVHCWFEGDGWGSIHPPLDCTSGDVGDITQALADQFAKNIAAHPADWHMLQPQWLADLSDAPTGPAEGSLMRIGMVCPYSFDVPGGVQSHVLQLAEVMRARGHEVSVLAPASPHALCPTTSSPPAGPSRFPTTVRWPGCSSARRSTARSESGSPKATSTCCTCTSPMRPACRCWALRIAAGPIVATFHTSTTKSLTLSVFQSMLRPMHEKIVGRIAVSDLARRWQMEALGSDAVEIPNGVDVDSLRLGAAAGRLSTAGQDGAVPGPLRRAPQGHVGAARRAAQGGRAFRRRATAHRRPRRRGRIAWPGRRIGEHIAFSWSGRRRR